MKRLSILMLAVTLAGCANTLYTPTVLDGSSTAKHGYREYDRCIRCGEGWIFLNIDDTQHLKD